MLPRRTENGFHAPPDDPAVRELYAALESVWRLEGWEAARAALDAALARSPGLEARIYCRLCGRNEAEAGGQIEIGPNPFSAEIHGNESPDALCPECYQGCADDV